VGLPPDTGRSCFRYRFGYEALEWDLGVPQQYDPIDLQDYYVRVSMQQQGYDPTPVWWGIFTEVTNTYMEGDNPAGEQRFDAQGIEYLLDRCPINGSKALKPNPSQSQNGPTNVTVSLNSALSFNRKPQKGHSLVGNRSKNKGPDGTYMFSAAAKKWTNLQAANYLLQYFGPQDIQFQIVGQTDPLDQMVFYHSIRHGTTVWKALCELIDHRKCLIMVPYVVDDQVYIYVDTTQDFPVQVAGMTIPPNSNPVQFTMPEEAPYDHLVDDVPIRQTDQTNYGTIMVYGSKVKMMFPAAFKSLTQINLPNGNLIHGGNYYLQDYLTGVPGGNGNADQNDRERQKDKYRDVFQRFLVDREWDGKIVVNGESTNVMPIPWPDGTVDIVPPPKAQKGLPTDVSGAQFVLFDKYYDKMLPLRKGVDYTQVPPKDNNPNPDTAGYVPLLGLYFDQANGAKHTADNLWHKFENLRKDNASLKPLTIHKADEELGVHIQGSPNHYLALNHWQGANATNHDPEIDYENICLVGSVDMDVRPCVVWQSGFNDRIKMETMPSCRFWYAVPNCPIDVDNNGQLQTIPDDNQILDDDSTVLQQVAAEMVGWYGTPRQTIALTIKQPGMYVQLGAFLQAINSADTTERIGTIINKITIDFDQQTTEICTGFQNLDFVKLLGRPEDLNEDEYGGDF
jgi:hypothetical protein